MSQGARFAKPAAGRAGLSWLMAGTAVLTWISSGAWAGALQAQELTAASAGAQLAQSSERRVNFAIPAQPLPNALNAFGRQADVQVTVEASATQGLQSAAVSGNLTVSEALARLLAGTGLTWRFAEERIVVLSKQEAGDNVLPPVTAETLTANPNAIIGNLPPEYAGGQVARGGQLGILGNKDLMDTPFNQSNYTSKLIKDQQTNFVSDVLKNDPSVIITSPPAAGLDAFSIRGFDVQNDDILFNGLAGTGPTFFDSAMSESVERVEVLKGPSALLNGISTAGSIGGTINIVPKRAGEEPLTQFTPSYEMDSQFGGHVDVARRYGRDGAFGVRFNGAYRNGDTAIENQSRESRMAAFGLDYREERFRLSSDLGYQYQDVQGLRGGLSVTGPAVPKAPDSRSNFHSPFAFSTPEVFYGTLRGEFDIADNITLFAATGRSEREQRGLLTFVTATNANGDLDPGFALGLADKMTRQSTEVGIRGSFETGPVSHQATIGYSWFDQEWRRGFASGATPASNIYNPTYGPDLSALVPDPDDAGKIQDLGLSSAFIGDTLSVLEDRAQLTLGARLQKIDQKNFDGAGSFTGGYDEDAVSPMVGLVVKPWHNVSLYGNYIEGLQQGQTAPDTTVNAGQIFSPYVTKQYEGGVKIDLGGLATTLAIYQVALPNGFINPSTNIFGVDGEQRHRGVELNVFGQATDSVRLLGGASYIDAELTKTEGGTNDGNTGIGVPKYRLIAGAEWDVPFLKGLTLTGRATYNSSAYLDAANTLQAPDWMQFDIGARYRIERAEDKPIIIRASLNNVFDSDYWIASSGGSLALSEPMTFKLSASIDF